MKDGFKIAACVLIALGGVSGRAAAQDRGGARLEARPAVTVSRADIASKYMAVDTLFTRTVSGERPLGTEQVAAVNRAFDGATMKFFRMDLGGAIGELETLNEMLAGGGAAQSVGAPIVVRVFPSVIEKGVDPEIAVCSLGPVSESGSLKAVFSLSTGGGGVSAVTRELRLTAGELLDVRFKARELWPVIGDGAADATHEVTVAIDSRREWASARAWTVKGGLAAARAELMKIALGEGSASRSSDRAAGIFRARCAVLEGEPGLSESSHYLADFPALIGAMKSEAESLRRGENPYRGRVGLVYRPLVRRAGDAGLPMWVFAPAKAAGGEPLPLIVALHGAGGDESMFATAYGAGMILKLAEEKGFVVAMPRSYGFGNLDVFDALLEDISLDYSIDRERVYVLGHSMGAGIASGIARKRAERVAGAVYMAGGGFGSPFGPPEMVEAHTLVIAGELDPLFVPSRMEGSARSVGAEFRVTPNYGHTLMVTANLRPAVEWLLTKKLSERPKHPEPRPDGPGDQGGAPEGDSKDEK